MGTAHVRPRMRVGEQLVSQQHKALHPKRTLRVGNSRLLSTTPVLEKPASIHLLRFKAPEKNRAVPVRNGADQKLLAVK
eukprot:826608-Pleurochrysis_carterae.AAC.2